MERDLNKLKTHSKRFWQKLARVQSTRKLHRNFYLFID